MNAATIDSFRSPLTDNSMKETGSYHFEQFAKVTSSQSRSSDITIVTAEGDKVSLSSSMNTSSTYTTYNQIGRLNTDAGIQDSETNMQSFDFEKSQGMTIQVEGDLNEKELRQIHKALKIVNRAMQEALSGDMEHALHQALKIGRLDTISSVDAVLEIEKKVSIENQVTISGSLPADQSQGVNHNMPPTIEAPLAGLDLGQAAPSRGLAQLETPKLNELMDNMVQALRDSDVAPKKLRQPIQALFQKIAKDIPEEAPQADYKRNVTQMMFKDLMERMDQLFDAKSIDDLPQDAETENQNNVNSESTNPLSA